MYFFVRFRKSFARFIWHISDPIKNILDGISEPVVVVSVVGLYRTGKSYLMNRLAGQQSGERKCLKSFSCAVQI